MTPQVQQQPFIRAASQSATSAHFRRNRWKSILIYGMMTLLALVFSIPFFWMFVGSLKTPQQVFDFNLLFPPVPQWENYPTAWGRAPFERYYFNSLLVTVSVVVCQLLTVIPAAYAVARLRFPGRNLLFALILLTMMVPIQVTFIPSFIIISRLGWRDAGGLLAHVHLQDTDGNHDRHWAPGDGDINWFALFEALADLDQIPRLIVEVRDQYVDRALNWLTRNDYFR